MYTYRIVSEAEGVPELTDLGVPTMSAPPSKGACFEIAFPNQYGYDVIRYEPAVGLRCRVIRTAEDGSEEECGGAVLRVSPAVHVSADGAGWQ